MANLISFLKAGCDVEYSSPEPKSFLDLMEYYIGTLYSKKFYFNNKGLTDLIGIEKFKNLEFLDISSNNISDLEPLSELKNLKFIRFSFNNIESLEPLKNLNIELLRCASNKISDPEPIYYMKNLIELDISYNQLTGVYERFNTLNNLEDLKSVIKYQRRKKILDLL